MGDKMNSKGEKAFEIGDIAQISSAPPHQIKLEELKRSQTMLRHISDHMLDLIVKTDLSGIVEYASPSHSDLLGRKIHDILGRPVFELVDPEDRVRIKAEFFQVIKTGASGRFEFRVQHVAGYDIHVETIGSPLLEQEHITGVILVSRDISERKTAEEKFASLLQFQNKMLDTAAIWIDTVDLEGNVLYWNRAAQDISGYSSDEVLGHTGIWKWLYPDAGYRNRILEKGKEVIYDKESFANQETTILRKDGEQRIISWNSNALTDSAGNPIGALAIGADVTRQRHAEMALHKSQEQFFKGFFSSPDPISINSLIDGRYVEVNDAYLELGGYKKEDIIGLTDLDIKIWANDEDRARLMQEVIDKGSLHNFETVLRMKSGKMFTFLISAQTFELNDNPHLIILARNITQRKQEEMALRQSEAKLAKIFNNSPDPISITSINEGVFTEVNHAFLNTTGYHQDEVIGKTSVGLGMWLSPEDRTFLVKAAELGAPAHAVETKMRMKSGEIRTFLLSAEVLLMNEDSHLLVISKDITERKCMEEALRISEEHFSKAFNASPLTMCICNLKSGVLLKVNNSFCRVLGYTKEEILGKSTLALGIWEDPALREKAKQKLLKYKSVKDLEVYFRKKTGELRLGLLTAERLDVEGTACMLSILTDITEQRQIEKELSRLDRLNLVGQFAASIGHEMRNPMTTVRGFLQVLKGKEKYVEDSETFDLMIEELDRANSIISEFLSLARDKFIKLELKNLNSVISHMFPLIQANAMSQDKNIEVKLNVIPNLLLDEKEIRQLLVNLVRNGLESMNPGGYLTIKTSLEDSGVILSVKDQGHGIPQEVLDKLGTPFLTTKEAGTGLGMAVCYGIANRHNAFIEVETSTTGSSFRVQFPLPSDQESGSSSPDGTMLKG